MSHRVPFFTPFVYSLSSHLLIKNNLLKVSNRLEIREEHTEKVKIVRTLAVVRTAEMKNLHTRYNITKTHHVRSFYSFSVIQQPAQFK